MFFFLPEEKSLATRFFVAIRFFKPAGKKKSKKENVKNGTIESDTSENGVLDLKQKKKNP